MTTNESQKAQDKQVALELDTEKQVLSKSIYRSTRGVYGLMPMRPVNVKVSDGIWGKQTLDVKNPDHRKLLRLRGNKQEIACEVTGEKFVVYTWFRDTELKWTVRPEVFLAKLTTDSSATQAEAEAF